MKSNIQKRILILSAKTGGGHRAAAEATIEYIHNHCKDVLVDHVDFLENAPRPYSDAPRYYSQFVKVPPAYGAFFKITEGKRQARFAIDAIAKNTKKQILKMIEEHPADAILSFHFGANPFLPILHKNNIHTPFVTVVTDLVTGHPMWFDTRADACIVPSPEAYARARYYKMPASKLQIAGLPIKEGFSVANIDKQQQKNQLGWPTNVPTVLIMAGGDGMGKIGSLVKKLDNSALPVHLAVICGRNEKLENQLKSRSWKKPVSVYGFCTNVADMMHGADLLLTKAGPGTIVEAMVARLPIVLYDFLPGQEEGNIEYVVSNGAGVWASTNSIALRATADILSGHIQIGGAAYEKAIVLHSNAAAKIVESVLKLC